MQRDRYAYRRLPIDRHGLTRRKTSGRCRGDNAEHRKNKLSQPWRIVAQALRKRNWTDSDERKAGKEMAAKKRKPARKRQLGLFPPSNGTDTSDAAGASIVDGLPRLRRIVFVAIKKSAAGLTDDQVEELTGMKHQTVSARRNELMNAGYIEDTGRRRDTRSGRSATVWQVAP